MDIEDGYLIDKNRPSLRKIFQHHTAVGNTHLLPFSELIKFSSAVRIFPDLLSSFELKRIVVRLTGKHTSHDADLAVTYLQFEKLIKHIAYQCFASLESDKLKLLLSHIRNACSLHYKVTLAVEGKEKDHIVDAPSPNAITFKVLESQRKNKKSEEASLRKTVPTLKLSTVLRRNQDLSLPSRAKEVNNKVRQLYALISPRVSTTSDPRRQGGLLTPTARTVLSPEMHSASMTAKSLRTPVFEFESEQRIRSSTLFSSGTESEVIQAVSGKPTPRDAGDKELVANMGKVFAAFKGRVETLLSHKRARPSTRVLDFVKTMRRFTFPRVLSSQTLVLKLSFQLWRVQTSIVRSKRFD